MKEGRGREMDRGRHAGSRVERGKRDVKEGGREMGKRAAWSLEGFGYFVKNECVERNFDSLLDLLKVSREKGCAH